MRSGNELEVVGVVELLRNILTKGVTSASWRDTPATSIIRIRPKKIAHGAFMRHFLVSIQLAYLVQGIQTRREATMEAEDFIFNNSSERKQVKKVSEVFPNISIAVFPQAFIIKTVHLRNLP